MTEMRSLSDTRADPYFDFAINLFDAVHYIDDFLYICDLISVIIGIPLNLVLIGAILLLKRLHLQRNFIWIGIGTSNIIILTSHLIADLFVRLGSSASARALSIWFVALSTATQTVNISFAHFERYMCIHHPNWHKTLFTTTSIIIVQLSSFILLFIVLGLTNIPVFQDLFLNQLFSSWGFKLVGSLIMGFLPLCLAGQIAVMRTRARQDKSDSIEKQSISNTDKSSSHFVLVGNNRTPIFVSVALVIGCVIRAHPSVEETHSQCSSFVQGFYYACGISSVVYSSIIDPIAFVALSSDLLACLKSRSHRSSTVAKELEQFEMAQI